MNTQFAVSSIINDETTFDSRGPSGWLRRIATLASVGGLVAGGCVMGATTPTLQQLQAALPTAGIQPLTQISAPVAPARKSAKAPALGFDLAKSTSKQVRAWAAAQDMQCKSGALGRLMRCDDAGNEGPVQLTFRFDGSGRLTSLDRVRTGMSIPGARAQFELAAAPLDREVGAATATVGDDRGFVTDAYQRSVRDYDYTGYRASVTATHFGTAGIQLRERYSVSR